MANSIAAGLQAEKVNDIAGFGAVAGCGCEEAGQGMFHVQLNRRLVDVRRYYLPARVSVVNGGVLDSGRLMGARLDRPLVI